MEARYVDQQFLAALVADPHGLAAVLAAIQADPRQWLCVGQEAVDYETYTLTTNVYDLVGILALAPAYYNRLLPLAVGEYWADPGTDEVYVRLADRQP